MPIEIRDVLTALAIAAAVVSTLLVNRNAKRATAVQLQNADLTRIRDLRAELKETKDEVALLRRQVTEMEQHMAEANQRAYAYAEREIEMRAYARMPGMTIELWRARFDDDAPAVSAR